MTLRVLAALPLVLWSAGPLAAQVNPRENNQEQRILQGERSGELGRGEAARLQRQQGHIDREVARDRAANGGVLTTAEHARVDAQQNRASHAIYDKKHNAVVR